MSDNTKIVVDVKKYEAQIHKAVTGILAKRNGFENLSGKIWGLLRESFGPLSLAEWKACRREMSNRLKAASFAEASVDTMFSCIEKLKANGKEMAETWTQAKADRSAIVAAEQAANPDKPKKGRPARQVVAKSEAGEEPAQQPQGDGTPEEVAATLAAGTLLLTFKAKVAALLLAGMDAETIEAALGDTLGGLADVVADAGDGIIRDAGEENDGEQVAAEIEALEAMVAQDAAAAA